MGATKRGPASVPALYRLGTAMQLIAGVILLLVIAWSPDLYVQAVATSVLMIAAGMQMRERP